MIFKHVIHFLIIISFLFFGNMLFAKNNFNREHKKTYSLDELYKIAYLNSEKIKIRGADLNLAEEYKNIAFSALLPRIASYADYSRYLNENFFQPKWTSTWGVSIEQSFTLNGRELIYYNLSKAYVKKTYFDLWALTEEYLFYVARLYYDVLRAVQAIDIAQANAKRLTSHKNAVSSRLKVKDVSKTAFFRSNAELSRSKTEIVKAQNRLKMARALLSRIACIQESFELVEIKPLEIKEDKTLKELIAKGLTTRGEIIAAKIEDKISKAKITVARGEYWPKISLKASYDDIDSNNKEFADHNISGTLSLDFLLYDGGMRNAKLTEALIHKTQAFFSILEIEKDILIEIKNAYLELMTQKSVLESSKEQLRYSMENFIAVEKQFKYGLVNSIDVMDANTLLVTSQIQVSDAKYSYEFAKLKLKRSTGVFLWDIFAMLKAQGVKIPTPGE